MDRRAELLERVRLDAESIMRIAQGGSNVPLDKYLDTTSLTALCDSLSLEPDNWQAEDLERILIVREGLYEVRNKLRDVGDDAEHSVDHVLSGMDRLYADFERALRELGKDELSKAQEHLARLQRGPQVASKSVVGNVTVLQEAATELLTQTHITQRKIEVNLFRVDQININVDVLRNAKLSVQRLSASVFAIRLSLEQSIIFQGVFRFLTEGADKILTDLKALAKQIQASYKDAKEFISDFSKLAETGGRFARLLSDFLAQIFSDNPPTERSIQLKIQTTLQTEAMLCAAPAGKNLLLLAGRRGQITLLDTSASRIIDQHRAGRDNINAATPFDTELMALGADDGLALVPHVGRQSTSIQAPYQEKVTAVAFVNWGAKGSRGAIVTGSQEGILRRWSMAGNLSQEGGNAKVRRQIHRIVVNDEEIIVGSGEDVLFVNENLEILRTVAMPFRVADMFIANKATLIVCGPGSIAHLNLAQGVYTRVMTASTAYNYTSVARLTDEIICVGTEEGKLFAVDFNSGEELGMLDLGFPLRGLFPFQQRLVAYGGNWNSRGRSIAFVTWQQLQK
jgi:hypothetical protein